MEDWRGKGFVSEEDMQQLLDDLREDHREATVVCPLIAACLAGALIYAIIALFFK